MNGVRYTPKSLKGWHKTRIFAVLLVKFNFCQKKSATKFLCVKIAAAKL